MNWSWLDLAFPWIGVVAAVVLLALLFGSNLRKGRLEPPLRSGPNYQLPGLPSEAERV